MLLISWTLRQICFFEFIRVEGGAKFMSYKSLETSAADRNW
jgi:hypothetical protein